jgi:DNA-binding NarL/FixJ family response regulator
LNSNTDRIGVPNPVSKLAASGFRPYILFARDNGAAQETPPAPQSRIMIVEDDYLVASQMEEALRQAGFDVVGVAGSAEEALQVAAGGQPDLVVMDVSLHGDRDGVDAALELFAKHGIRCIFATAHHNALVRRRAEPALPLAWLAKPYAMWALVEIVQNAFRQLRTD